MTTTPIARYDLEGPNNARWREREPGAAWSEASTSPLGIYFGIQDYILGWMHAQGVNETYAWPSGSGHTGSIVHPEKTVRSDDMVVFSRDGVIGPMTIAMLTYILRYQEGYQAALLADLRNRRVSKATMTAILSILRTPRTVEILSTAVMPPFGRAIATPQLSMTVSPTREPTTVAVGEPLSVPPAPSTPPTTPEAPAPADVTPVSWYEPEPPAAAPPAPAPRATGVPTWALVAGAATIAGIGYIAYARLRRDPLRANPGPEASVPFPWLPVLGTSSVLAVGGYLLMRHTEPANPQPAAPATQGAQATSQAPVTTASEPALPEPAPSAPTHTSRPQTPVPVFQPPPPSNYVAPPPASAPVQAPAPAAPRRARISVISRSRVGLLHEPDQASADLAMHRVYLNLGGASVGRWATPAMIERSGGTTLLAPWFRIGAELEIAEGADPSVARVIAQRFAAQIANAYPAVSSGWNDPVVEPV